MTSRRRLLGWVRRHKLAAIIAVLAVVLGVTGPVLLGVGAARHSQATANGTPGAAAGTTPSPVGGTTAATPGASSPAQESTAGAGSPPVTALPVLPTTRNPREYATAFAQVVLAQDTRVLGAHDYWAWAVAALDPSLPQASSADAQANLERVIPSDDAWATMRQAQQYYTAQLEAPVDVTGQFLQGLDPDQQSQARATGATYWRFYAQQTTTYTDNGRVASTTRPVTAYVCVVRHSGQPVRLASAAVVPGRQGDTTGQSGAGQ